MFSLFFYLYAPMKLNSLILLRGLPGSGKTTLAKVLSEEGKYPIHSVDDYFTDKETGDYQFDFRNNQYAYKQCEELTEGSMLQSISKVIVHNTFTLDWEPEPYFRLAAKYNYNLFVVTVENYHQTGNAHNVSEEQLK